MVDEQFAVDSYYGGNWIIWLLFAIILLALICSFFRPFPIVY